MKLKAVLGMWTREIPLTAMTRHRASSDGTGDVVSVGTGIVVHEQIRALAADFFMGRAKRGGGPGGDVREGCSPGL